MKAADRARIEQAVKEVAARIAKYSGKPFNEQNTKASLIEPVLESLGWDTRDPEQVNREFKTNTKDNPVDYALMILRQPRLVVEAKALGESMDDVKWMNQTIAYASISGATWCVLTNGDEYQIYKATAPVAAKDKLLFAVRVSSDPTARVTDILSLVSHANLGENFIETMWQTQHIDRRVRVALEGLFADRDRKLAIAVRQRDSGLSVKDIAGSLRRLSVRIEQQEVRLPAKGDKGARAPGSAPKAQAGKAPKPTAPKTPSVKVELSQLIAAGLLKPGARLFRLYRKRLVEAKLLPDGQVEFDGTVYASASTAANHARGSITGRPMATNGWAFWQVEGPIGKPQALEEVRAKFATGGT